MSKKNFKEGLVSGIPIAMGYLPVSFAFGITAVNGGLSVFESVLISMVNLTSSGQLAGLNVMLTTASVTEMFFTQLVINLRYALMSLSLTQKLNEKVNGISRCIIAFFNTDEIFALSSQRGDITLSYMLGLSFLPYFGWSGGTLLGAIFGGILPVGLSSAFNLAIYAMFIALIVPAAKTNRKVLFVICLSSAISIGIYFLKTIPFGTAVIIASVCAATIGAILFPVSEQEE